MHTYVYTCIYTCIHAGNQTIKPNTAGENRFSSPSATNRAHTSRSRSPQSRNLSRDKTRPPNPAVKDKDSDTDKSGRSRSPNMDKIRPPQDSDPDKFRDRGSPHADNKKQQPHAGGSPMIGVHAGQASGAY